MAYYADGKKPNHISLYRHYLNCCERLGIPGMEKSLDEMMVLDYLIANEDRHQNNFGAIRRADTLQYLGAAPIFDRKDAEGLLHMTATATLPWFIH